MKPTIIFILCMASLLLLTRVIARSGSPAITAGFKILMQKGHLDVMVTVTNTGRESAYKVGAKLRVFEKTWTARSIDRLEVKQTATFTLKPFLSKSIKGRYPITAEITYRDIHRHPFSTLVAATVKAQEDEPSTISVTASDISIDPGGNLIVTVNNTGRRSKKVRVSLILPKGITADHHRQIFRLDNRVKKLVFSISNKKKRPGTLHPYYVFLEYDQEGIHHSAFTGGKIEIRDDTIKWFARTRWHWLAGLGVLILIWGTVASVRRQT